MDRIEEWRLFVEVAHRRSFRATATARGRSPQAVTRAIAGLEARLGRRLLNRTTRAVSLTDAGERYLARCRRVLGEIDQLDDIDDSGELRGVLTVTAPVLFGQLHVVPIVTELLARHPRVDVRLGLSDRVASLADEGIDVAIRIGALPESSLQARRLGQVRLVTAASPAYLARHGVPRDPAALAGHACIAFTGATPIVDRWSYAAGGRRERAVAVHPRLVVDTGPAAIDAAIAGAGVVRALSYQVDELVAQRRLRLVLDRFAPPPVPVHLVRLPGAHVRLADAFAELAGERLRARFER